MIKTIISLAMIKVSWDHLKKDYIENFIPFIATLVKKKDYETIKVVQVCADFKEEFGLIIPYHPMVTILNRARRRKILKKQRDSYIPIKDTILRWDFTDISKKQERKHEKVINEFIDFSKDKYNVDLDREEAETIFISFLKRYDLDILFASQEKSVLPEVKQSKRDQFLVSNFIKYAYKAEPEYFRFLADIAIGHILASNLLYGSEFKKFEAKFRNLNLYFDTGFILRLLGGEGEEREWIYTDLLKKLSDQRARFFIFAHTYDEIMGTLENCLKWVEDINYDPSRATPILKYFIEKGCTQSDVQRFIVTLDNSLMEHNIRKTAPPNLADYNKYQIDEESLRTCIINTYTESNPFFNEWEKDIVMRRDIRSLSTVNKLRKGKEPKSIKQAMHIFITTNGSLAYANRKFEVSERGERFFIPACLTDVFIGTLLWLDSPAQVVALNEKKIIADCYAALQPNKVLIKKFVKEVEKLKNEQKVLPEECYLLRCSIVARELLTEKTMGDPENFTENTTLEILEELEGRIKKEEEQKYLKEKEKNEKIKQDFETIKKEKRNIESIIERRAEKISDIISWFLFGVLSTLCILGAIIQYFPILLSKEWLRWSSLFVTLIFVGGSIALGINIKGFKDKIQNFIKVKIIRWLKG
jgi:hypothetical protein